MSTSRDLSPFALPVLTLVLMFTACAPTSPGIDTACKDLSGSNRLAVLQLDPQSSSGVTGDPQILPLPESYGSKTTHGRQIEENPPTGWVIGQVAVVGHSGDRVVARGISAEQDLGQYLESHESVLEPVAPAADTSVRLFLVAYPELPEDSAETPRDLALETGATLGTHRISTGPGRFVVSLLFDEEGTIVSAELQLVEGFAEYSSAASEFSRSAHDRFLRDHWEELESIFEASYQNGPGRALVESAIIRVSNEGALAVEGSFVYPATACRPEGIRIERASPP